MNILVAGMGRSGSTAIFNLIKTLLEQKYDEVYAVFEDDYKESDRKEVNIIKTHFNDHSEWADFIITTRRDIRDVISSFKQFNPTYGNKTKQWTKAFMNWHKRWVDKTDYEVVYETFIKDREKIINEMASLFKIENYDIGEINEKIDSLYNIRNIVGRFDKETLIHPNHISKTKGKIGSYKEILSVGEIKIIEDTSIEWLKKYGYEK